MKEKIIATVDFVAYLLFAFVGIAGLIALSTGNTVGGVITLVAGWIIACILSGSWFVLSSIANNTAETNRLLKKLIEKEN